MFLEFIHNNITLVITLVKMHMPILAMTPVYLRGTHLYPASPMMHDVCSATLDHDVS